MIKYILKEIFYTIPKEIWDNGAWDRQDHENVFEWLISFFFLTLFSLLCFEIALCRIGFLMGVAVYMIKTLRRSNHE